MTDATRRRAAKLAGELEELSRLLRRRVLLLGLARCLSLALLGALLLFLLDLLFTPPLATRLVLAAAWVTVTILALRRFLLRPLALVFTPEAMALALERHFPQLQQILISGIQLAGREEGEGTSRAMVHRLLKQAEERFTGLEGREIFHPGPVRLQGAAALAMLLLTVGIALVYPAETGVWLQRLLGMEASYPRETRLFVVLPESSPTRRVDRERGLVTLARGADLPVGVRVEGRVPDSVRLLGDDDSVATMAPVDRALFRHTYRDIDESFAFHPAGGDDRRGDRTIRVEVLDAPAVESLGIRVTPPAYTGSSPYERDGGHVEALTGSEVEITVRPNRPVREAFLQFDSLAGIPLEKDDRGLLRGSFTVTKNDRYRVRLEGESRLKNVDPGSYLVIAVPDTSPRMSVAAPGLASSPYTEKGVVPVRCRVRDDYGLVRGVIAIVAPGGKELLLERILTWGKDDPGGPRDRSLVTLVPIRSIGVDGGTPPSAGDTCLLRLAAEDNRLPEPGRGGPAQDWRLNLVEKNELKREASDRMRRRRTEVEGALRAQRELVRRMEAARELALREPARRTAMQGIHNGQSRLASLVGRIRVGFCRVFDLYLFGGTDLIEEATAGTLRDAYLAHYRKQLEQEPYDSRFYRGLWRRKQEGSLLLSSHPALILDLAELAGRLEEEVFPAAARALTLAVSAAAPEQLEAGATDAFAAQERAVALLEQILEVLQEWDEFDDVLKKLRVLKESQFSIWGRTRERLTHPGEGSGEQ